MVFFNDNFNVRMSQAAYILISVGGLETNLETSLPGLGLEPSGPGLDIGL